MYGITKLYLKFGLHTYLSMAGLSMPPKTVGSSSLLLATPGKVCSPPHLSPRYNTSLSHLLTYHPNHPHGKKLSISGPVYAGYIALLTGARCSIDFHQIARWFMPFITYRIFAAELALHRGEARHLQEQTWHTAFILLLVSQRRETLWNHV